MKIKNKIILFIFFLFFIPHSYGNEIELISSNMFVEDNGNTIIAKNVKTIIKSENVEVISDKARYNKKDNIIIYSDNVIYYDFQNDIVIRGDRITYNKNKNLVYSTGYTEFDVKDKYKIDSKNVYYDRVSQLIYGDEKTIINDNKKNTYKLEERYRFDLNSEIIKSKKSNILDENENLYVFDDIIINLKNNEIAGKELNVNFVDSYFGNPNNQPVLKGKGSTSDKLKTKIYKAAFTTCNIENKKCPAWELQSEEFVHDKEKKVFEYKNSWLKVFDKKIFYFPFFSHPDPSVKRKSGFLTPVYGTSSKKGSWVNIPYFKVINDEKDLTFSPRIYADDKFILQSEYRQAFENSNLISDFSLNHDGKNNNSHLFAKLTGDLSYKSKFDFKFQNVSNDDYLKIHNLSNSSPLIKNESLLTTQLDIKKNIDENTNLDTSFIVYEDLSKKDSDRFQYILPWFNFTKNLEIQDDYKGNFKFTSNGFQKNYDTNKYESLLINDFLFQSDNIISENGLLSNYDLLVKNFNSYTENSTSYNEKEDYEVFGSLLLKSSFPLKKVSEYSQNYLKPIVALKYSPNGTKNISDNDVRLDYNNIFSLNRIGTNEIVEGGRSIAIGLEYEKVNLENKKIIGFNIANSISDKKNVNLPTKSKLNDTRTDIVGNLSFNPNDILNFDYSFSYDKNLNGSNYDSISTSLNLNNFITKFNFLSEDGNIGNNEIISNTTTYKFDSENSIKFNTSKDLKNDFTEYYNLIYSYETDCLIASAEYSKKFYRDGNLVPDKSLMFYIRFIPFVELKPAAVSLDSYN